jgi:aldose 1-epimerase
VLVPASQLWELEEYLPTGRKLPVPEPFDLRRGPALAGLKLDHVFTGLSFSQGWCRALVTDSEAQVQLELRAGELFREMVVYTPPARGSICLEPYTCVTDAINLQPRGVDAGLRVLEPGQSAEGTMVLEVSGLDS